MLLDGETARFLGAEGEVVFIFNAPEIYEVETLPALSHVRR